MHDTPLWIYVFTAATALGVLLQAGVLIGMLVVMKKAIGRANELSKQVELHAIPALAAARHLLEDVSPRLKTAAENVMEASKTLRAQSSHVNETLDDLLKKTEAQAARVDEMVTGTLNTIAHATATLQRAASAPVRQIGALLNGLRAGFDVLRSKERATHVAADGDHFI